MFADAIFDASAARGGQRKPKGEIMVRETIYTTAPAAYDGFSTREESADCGRDGGKVVRRVSLETADYQWQLGRYASGLYMALRPDAWRQLVSAGLATSTEPKPQPPSADAAAIAAAVISLFAATDRVNHGFWQVPNSAMVELIRTVEAAGFTV